MIENEELCNGHAYSHCHVYHGWKNKLSAILNIPGASSPDFFILTMPRYLAEATTLFWVFRNRFVRQCGRVNKVLDEEQGDPDSSSTSDTNPLGDLG